MYLLRLQTLSSREGSEPRILAGWKKHSWTWGLPTVPPPFGSWPQWSRSERSEDIPAALPWTVSLRPRFFTAQDCCTRSRICCLPYEVPRVRVKLTAFFLVWRDPGVSLKGEFPVSHVGFTPSLLYSSTQHSPESFTHLKTGWAQDAWLQWSYVNWYFNLDISRWP